MKTLNDILHQIPAIRVAGNTDVPVTGLRLDSRKAGAGDAYIAVKGTTVDGHAFIPQVIAQGARVIVCEDWPAELPADVTCIQVANARQASALMAGNFYDHPSRAMKLVGVTGTNGKTTIATLLYEVYKSAGYRTGLLSTIENKIDDTVIPSTHTTPDPIVLNELLRTMADAGCTYAFMEVSSHAADQDRIAGLTFAGAIFTNITHDHLDYHKTFAEYIKAKKKFFDGLDADAFALVNTDDKRGEVMLQNTAARKYTYAVKSFADYNFKIVENGFAGLVLRWGNEDVHTQMIGRFNAYNLLAIFATCVLLGMDEREALSRISLLRGATGRFDHFVSAKERITGIVDYAHTPDALKNVLDTMNEIRTGNEQVITVVGCGGNRDKAKRPEMAHIASELSTKVILTSDNPRDEEPDAILKDMQAGVPPHQYNKVMTVTDRREAIRVACNLAGKKDIVLLAGKGHETYQEIKGVRHPFDDKIILQETLNELDK